MYYNCTLLLEIVVIITSHSISIALEKRVQSQTVLQVVLIQWD